MRFTPIPHPTGVGLTSEDERTVISWPRYKYSDTVRFGFGAVIYAWIFNSYPTAFPYGNGMVLHFYQQQESSTTKTVHKVINKGLKTYV